MTSLGEWFVNSGSRCAKTRRSIPTNSSSIVVSGLLNVNKPAGPSSSAVLQHVKRFLRIAHAGHCGTLDPAASGVLLVLLGRATQHQEQLMKQDKTYQGTLILGCRTDSGDLKGRVLETVTSDPFPIETLRSTARQFCGESLQTPPMYSAVKVGGRPLYQWARQGLVVKRAPRPVTIHSFEITDYTHPNVNFRVHCSSGTYIRVIAEEFGGVLGCGAVLGHLTRQQIGPYSLEHSVSIEEMEKNGREWVLERVLPL